MALRPSTRRSRDTNGCTASGPARPPHTSSTSRSAETGTLPATRIRASTARWVGPPRRGDTPEATASSVPSTRSVTGATVRPGTPDPSKMVPPPRTSSYQLALGDVEPFGPFGAWGSVGGSPALTPGAGSPNVHTVGGPDYSAWHYAP